MESIEDQLLGILNSVKANAGEEPPVVEAGDGPEPVGGAAKPEPRPAFSSSAAFQRRDTHPLVYDILLLARYGPEWLSWEPETVWHEIEADFKVTPSVHARNKINALKTMHVVDTPWTAWEVFNVVVQALTDVIPDFRLLQKPAPTQLMPAVDIMAMVKRRSYSEEVGRYVAACFLDDGVYFLPSPVEFAQPYAVISRYRCRKCGNIDTDDENQMCDSCGAPQIMLEKTMEYDPAPVKERYDVVMKDGDQRDYYLQEDVVDVQVAKLLLAQQRRVEYAARLKQQVEAIR